MSKYGQVAVTAASLARSGMNPLDAWQIAARQVFSTQNASRDKACPKCAFLGLAENGLIKGVPQGRYTKSVDNKRYAVSAVNQIQNNPNLANNTTQLWQIVSGGNKQHNGQLDVVIGLWSNGDI